MNVKGQATGKKPTPYGKRKHDLMNLNCELNEAYLRRDPAVFDRIMADDFVFTNPTGKGTNKAQEIANIKSRDLAFEFFDLDDVQVRVYGSAAVVTGRATVKGRLKGQDISGQYRYTNTYAKRQGTWQMVTAHVSSS